MRHVTARGITSEDGVYASHDPIMCCPEGCGKYPSSDPDIAQQDANGKHLIYPGPNGVDQHYMGRPVYWWECNCSERRTIHARAEHDVYGPDGVSVSGPIATARYYAYLIASDPRPAPPTGWRSYRNAAAYEGERYCEAIRGARAMRGRSFSRGLSGPHREARAYSDEIVQGIPAPWTYSR